MCGIVDNTAIGIGHLSNSWVRVGVRAVVEEKPFSHYITEPRPDVFIVMEDIDDLTTQSPKWHVNHTLEGVKNVLP